MPGSPRSIAADLRTALVDGGLSVVFQPEYDLLTDTIVAVEALARWRHPLRGEIDPSDFVPLAEQSDLIVELGGWVLETALTEFAVWTAQLPDLDVVLRFNAAVTQLARPEFVADLDSALTRHGVGAERVCIEITESTQSRQGGGLADSIRGLRAMGVAVAVDDLAAGYSTLGMLRAHPIDVVKIDRSLVAGIDTDPRAVAIVRAIVQMAADLDLTLVAEGIETPAERETVVRLGCRRGQGYLLSLPVSGTDAVRLLDRQGARRG